MGRKRGILGVLVVVLMLLSVLPTMVIPTTTAAATTVSLTTDRDNFVRQDTPDSSYANSPISVCSRSNPPNWNNRSLVHFDLSAIPADATVNSAYLNLYVVGVTGTGARTNDVHRVTSAWTSAVTWNTQPYFFNMPTASVDPGAAGSWVSWEVTADVQAFLSGTANHGWLIKEKVEDRDPWAKTTYASLENEPSLIPYLAIGYVGGTPLPVAAFGSDAQSGTAPLTVNFADQSSGSPTSWAWDFDSDGTVDSTEQNPSYTYTAAGTYTVKLTASNAGGSDDEMKIDYVTVTSPTVAPLWGPYVTGTTTTAAMVDVKTALATGVTVQYATEAEYGTSGSYNQTVTDNASTELHHVALSGLDPDTVYHYRVLCGEETSGDCRFRTFPNSGAVNFVVVSDTQDQLPLFSQSERFQLVADSIAAQPDVAFVLITGDLVNDGSDLACWDRFFDAGRQMLATTTIYTALGNHEDNDPLYYEIFGLPAYYSFDCGDAHFTVLDSNLDTTAQAAWLGGDLDSGKAWKFVGFHHPFYTSDPNHFGGYANLRAEWEAVFLSHGVDAVWNGHFHDYERYLEYGIQYMVVGTGGGPLYQLGEERYDGYQNGLQNSLAYAMVAVDSAGEYATMDIVRVADVSLDNSEVTTVYPPGTLFETVVITQEQPAWDLNGDRVCNIGDAVVAGLRWGETGAPGWIMQDLNGDGVINIGDVVVLGLHWGETW